MLEEQGEPDRARRALRELVQAEEALRAIRFASLRQHLEAIQSAVA